MEFLPSLFNALINSGMVPTNVLYAVAGGMSVAFIIQLCYYLGVYGHIAKFRNNRGIRRDILPEPVSVIVVVRENSYYYIENCLPLLLSQDYDDYEVVVVDCSYTEEISRMLADLALAEPRLKLTRIQAQTNVDHGIKLALTVGIKAASYENLVFTTIDSYPASRKWLSLMAKGFIGGEVVIGYCGIECKKGFANGWMRCSRLMSSVRYLADAIKGRPYRGISHNLGYTKELYFYNKGFNYLNMNVGDDDLFIRKISTGRSVSVVMNPNATMRQMVYGGLGWWNSMNRYLGAAYRYYPAGVRFKTGLELWSRFLFFACAAALLVILPAYLKIVPAFFLSMRLLAVELKIWRVCKRLGEKKMMGIYIIYDLLSPLTELVSAVGRGIGSPKSVWK